MPHAPIVSFDKLVITNPKRAAAAPVGRDHWFPYYAGFSSEFARQLIASSSLPKGSVLMDPWNGSGTTTSSAVVNGHKAIGFDVNPVMAVVAKARLLPQCEIASIAPLMADILEKATGTGGDLDISDPLGIWLAPAAVLTLRRIERAIYRLLVSASGTRAATDSVQDLSSLASFFYVALFRTLRLLLRRFRGSNPTWITRPLTFGHRIRPSTSTIRNCFSDHVGQMVLRASSIPEHKPRTSSSTIGVASSERLPVRRGTVDFVLSSPPYCTRIDYCVATLPELAALGFDVDTRLGELRHRLIGTPTIHAATPAPNTSWGKTCVALLDRISRHRSKAARSYYFKTYTQYFAAMSRSFSELGRCLKRRGYCILVVQDSHFKNVHVDLATVFREMGLAASLELRRREDFPISRTFGSINLKARAYRDASSATESVLCFTKDA
jgi:hypothetical protein